MKDQGFDFVPEGYLRRLSKSVFMGEKQEKVGRNNKDGLERRDKDICYLYRTSCFTIKTLAYVFQLSESSIKRIIYKEG